MEEIYEALGLKEDAPVAQVVQAIGALKDKNEDKDAIIEGMTNQISNLEEQIESISSGVAEARVKDLVRKVQNETGCHVGKDHMARLQKKASQHLYASEDDQKEIWEDMKSLTIAYGTKLNLDEKIKSLTNTREDESDEDRRYNKAEKLVKSGEAKSYDEAFDLLLEQETTNED